MIVETDPVWKIGGRHRVAVELSTRIPVELEEVTTQRRNPPRLFAHFDVSARKSVLDGFGPPVPLVHELSLSRSHQPSVVNLDFRVALTSDIAKLLFRRHKPVQDGVTLRFKFRGVFRSRSGSPRGLSGKDVFGPMGAFSPDDDDRKWLMKVPDEDKHTDFVEDLTFELEDTRPPPLLELHVESTPTRPGDPLQLRWVKEHLDAPTQVLLECNRGRSWGTIGILTATGEFATEPTNPHRMEQPKGQVTADLGSLADAGGRFRLRLVTTQLPQMEILCEPFEVQVAAIELSSVPRTVDQPFGLHWILQPYPAGGASVILERQEGDQWSEVGVLGRKGTVFEARDEQRRIFHTPGPMGARPGIRLGEPGAAGGTFRLTLCVDQSGLRKNTEAFTVEG